MYTASLVFVADQVVLLEFFAQCASVKAQHQRGLGLVVAVTESRRLPTSIANGSLSLAALNVLATGTGKCSALVMLQFPY